MSKFLCAILLAVLLPCTSFSEVLVGVSPFGLQSDNFSCEDLLSSLDQFNKPKDKFAVAFLYNTFGNNNNCLFTLLSDPRLKAIMIHLFNGPCLRNTRCGKYEVFSGLSLRSADIKLRKDNPQLWQKLEEQMQSLSLLLKNNKRPDTSCYVSGVLESNFSKRTTRKINKKLRQYFPECKIVYNPMLPEPNFRPGFLGADVLESHGPTPYFSTRQCIANTDGTDLDFRKRRALNNNSIPERKIIPYLKKNSKCEIVFLWIREDNCTAFNKRGKFIDPRKRQCTNPKNVFSLRVKKLVEFIRKYQSP